MTINKDAFAAADEPGLNQDKDFEKSSARLARNASVVAGATLISRFLGFIRDLIIAFTLGAGPVADAFFVAFRLPNLLRRLFAEGSLTMAFVPVFTRTRNDHGTRQAFILARSVQLWIIIIVGGITLLAVALASPLTTLIAPGFRTHDQVFELAVSLVRICFPYILFISSVALCMGILNSMNRFFAPAFAPAVMNLTLIVFALAAHYSGWNVAYGLALGVIFSGLFQWLFQLPFLTRCGFSWTGPFEMFHPGIIRMGRLMLPTVLGAAVYQLNILLGTVLASFLPRGSISYLYYADRLVQLPLGVFAVAISTAALPSLSALAGKGDISGFKKTLNHSLGLTLFIALPCTAGLMGMSQPLIDIVFGRGEFQEQAVQATAAALVGYAAGLPAFSCVRPLVSAFFALEDTRTPVKTAVISLVANIGLGLILMSFLDHLGLALAASLASWVNVLLLAYFLKKKTGRWLTGQSSLVRMLGLSCILLLGLNFLSMTGWAAISMIPVWAALYFLGAALFGIPELRTLLKMIKK